MKKKLVISAMIFGVVVLALLVQLFLSQNQSKTGTPQVPVSNVEVNTVADIETEIESVSKNYASQKYGFSLNYPSDFRINEVDSEGEPQPGGTVYVVQFGDGAVTDFGTEYEKGITVLVAEKAEGDTGSFLLAPNGMDAFLTQETMVDGQKAKVYNDGQVYVVGRNNYEYTMILGEGANQATKNTFAKIVSSFKFTK